MTLYKTLFFIMFIATPVVSTENTALEHYQESIQKILATLNKSLPREIHFCNFKQYGNGPLRSVYLSRDPGTHHGALQRIYQYKNHLQPPEPPAVFVHTPQDPKDFNDYRETQNPYSGRNILTTIRDRS